MFDNRGFRDVDMNKVRPATVLPYLSVHLTGSATSEVKPPGDWLYLPPMRYYRASMIGVTTWRDGCQSSGHDTSCSYDRRTA